MIKSAEATNSANWLKKEFHTQYSTTKLLETRALVLKNQQILDLGRIPKTQYGRGGQAAYSHQNQTYYNHGRGGHGPFHPRYGGGYQNNNYNHGRGNSRGYGRGNGGGYGRGFSGGYNGGKGQYNRRPQGHFNDYQRPRAPPSTPTVPYPSKAERKVWAKDLDTRVKDTHRPSMNVDNMCCRYHMQGQVCVNEQVQQGKACRNHRGKTRLHICVCGEAHPTYECKTAFD